MMVSVEGNGWATNEYKEGGQDVIKIPFFSTEPFPVTDIRTTSFIFPVTKIFILI
jgi:hypothetical protein